MLTAKPAARKHYNIVLWHPELCNEGCVYQPSISGDFRDDRRLRSSGTTTGTELTLIYKLLPDEQKYEDGWKSFLNELQFFLGDLEWAT
jgi:hypothetical protein